MIKYDCSFCDKKREDARHIVAGPGVNICDECIWICVGLIAEEEKAKLKVKTEDQSVTDVSDA